MALERDVFGTTCVQAILRFLSLHAHSDGTCPAPNCSFNVGFESPCENFLMAHTSLISLDNFIHACTNFYMFHYSLMVIVFTAVLKLYGITNFTSHDFFAFSDSSCKTRVIFSFFKLFFWLSRVYVCMCVCLFVVFCHHVRLNPEI